MNRVRPPSRYRYGDGPEQFADLYVPEGPGPHPVMIVVHGGGFLADHLGNDGRGGGRGDPE